MGVSEHLIGRMKELFRNTKVRIEINGKVIDEFEVREGVRQGCPLSPTLFNIAVADLEEEMAKVQGSGKKLGKRRLRSLSYADDVVLFAENEEMMKEMLKKLRKWISGKGLELNANKTNDGARGNEYWKKEEDRKCRACMKEEETI